jgi:1-deoxy-D-xylulose-5-phosphate synthase
MMSKTKQGIRYMLVPGMFFEELGFKYIGPIDGHDIKSLIITLNMSKNLKGPVLIHVNTKKGKGYGYSEVWPGRFHGVELFDIVTGESKKVKKLSYSDIFANTLEELADKDKSIVAITAAMLIGVGLDHFAKTYPDRTFDVGIAEAHAVTFAAGLACGGLKPVVAIYSTFLQRAFDSIIHDVCIQNLPVVFAVDRAGIVGVDGETHQGLFDIGYLSIIPNMTVMAPKNGQELSSMLKFAFKLNSPVAIRYPKEEISSLFEDIDSPIVYGKAEYIYRAYGDYRVAIVSVGAMINTAYGVYKFFKKDEICAALINARFMKPLDMDMMTDLAGYDRVVVIEDASIVSGFGSNLLSAMNINGISTSNLRIFAFPDKFIQAGSREQLFDMYSLTPEKIYDQIREH